MSRLLASPCDFKTGFSVSTCDKTTIISCHKKEFELDSQGYQYFNYDLTYCGLIMLMTPYVNIELGQQIGSSNGLLPDGTKPLPEPMLTYRQ